MNMNTSEQHPIYKVVLAWVLLAPLLFFAARGTFSFDRARSGNVADEQQSAITDTRSGSSYYEAEQILMYLIVAALLVRCAPDMWNAVQENLLVFSLPVLALLSACWSQHATKTIVFGGTAILLTAFGIYLSRRFSPQRQIELFMFVGWVTIILSFIAVVFFPSAGIWEMDGKGAWRGMFVQKNHLGLNIVLLSYAGICSKPRNFLQLFGVCIYMTAAVVLSIMSQSRTGWILLALSAFFVVFLRVIEKMKLAQRLLLCLLLTVGIGVVAGAALTHLPQIATAIGKDPTLTGRTQVWTASAGAMLKRPILGYGYRAFWEGLKGESLNVALEVGSTNLTNSENGVLEIWLELGIVGVLLMFLILFHTCRNALKCFGRDAPNYVHWYILILFFNMLALFDGEKIMFPHTIEWLLLVMASAGLAAEARRIREQKAV